MEISDALKALDALAQETRLGVFRLLIQEGPSGLPAGEVSMRLDVPNNTLSFHLDRLRHAGLVNQRREGRRIFYSASYEAMRGLLGFLTENCCAGSPEGCPPVCEPHNPRHAEAGAERTGEKGENSQA